ncbi:hypothetical protein HPB50_019488 [Hyalomma asiaticum]|uniref:Uncharacterized protein n=1 Tax=Hyalomma asiaticum TaxID=266040 RepID=A0ACB7SGE1_HYAAI|nr:hypothetical protein HPB50_019488 [Hyalomma asiaticum]
MTETHDVISGLQDAMGHGTFQRRVLLFGVLSTLVLLCHAFSFRLVARPQLVNSTRNEVPCKAWHYDTASSQDSIVSEWDLVCDRSWMLPFSSAAYISGAIVCVPVSGVAADYWGRKPVINAWIAALLVAGIGCVAASSYSLFVTSRFVVSAANSSITVIVLILLFEVTSEERLILFMLIFATSGSVLLPFVYRLIELYRLNWRMNQMVLMLPTSLLVSCLYLIEESPLWLMVNWKTRAAEQVILLAAAVNGVSAQSASEAFQRIREKVGRLDLGRDTTFVVSPHTFFQESLVRWTTLPVELCWFTTFFGFYGINFRGLSAPPVAPTVLEDQLFVALQAPFVAASYWSLRRAGLRVTLCVLLCLTSATCAMQSVVNAGPVDVAGVIRRVLITSVLCPVYLYTAQTFPAQVRCMGVCASYAVGQFGALGGSLLGRSNETAFDTLLGVTAFAAFCGLLSVADSAPFTPDPKALRPFTSPEGTSAFHYPGAETASKARTTETAQLRRKASVVSFAAVEVKTVPRWPSSSVSCRRSLSK